MEINTEKLTPLHFKHVNFYYRPINDAIELVIIEVWFTDICDFG